ncbi:MAG: hypothetical protein CVU36_23455 [Betaproteobacteria bacterium HGW-Betaproteobacteria-9]|nr:MAG: hypothetical protein CVU36_23455 [Betaproteobacteria bacterium HGW-Betaproteobacteria-9]
MQRFKDEQRRATPSGRGLLVLWVAAGVAVTLYLVLPLHIYSFQARPLFGPWQLGADHRFELGSDVRELVVRTPRAPPALHLKLSNPQELVFSLHGNGGNAEIWFKSADIYREADLALFVTDYQDFGKISGSIQNEGQLHSAVRAACALVIPGDAHLPKVIQGLSPGAALAARLFAEVQPALTILVQPYRSIKALANERYPFVPIVLLRCHLRTRNNVARIARSSLLINGDRDKKIIGLAHSQSTIKSARLGKLVTMRSAGSSDVSKLPLFREAVQLALRDLGTPEAPLVRSISTGAAVGRRR